MGNLLCWELVGCFNEASKNRIMIRSLKRKLLDCFLTVVILFIGFPLVAQISYYKTYTGDNFDVGQGIVQLPDGKLGVTGASSSLKGQGNQVFIMVVDSLGNHEWTKPYGGNNNDWGRRIFHEEGKGFWVAGYSNSFNVSANFDFVLFEIDEEGELLNTFSYGTDDWERLWDAIRLEDGGFFLVGEKSGVNSLEEDMFLVRTDALGDTLWTKVWQTQGSDIAYAVTQLNDSTVLVAGTAFDENEEQRASLFAFDLDGELKWQRYYGDQAKSTVFKDISCIEDRVYVAGGLVDEDSGDIGNWVLRLDVNGDVVRERSFARQGKDYASTILALPNSRLYWTLFSESPEDNVYPGGADLFLLRFNWNVSYHWSRSFSAFDPDLAHQMIPTSDGGLAIVGEVSDKRNTLSPGRHVLIIKVGPDDEMDLVRDQGNDLVNLESVIENVSFQVYPNPVQNQLHLKGIDDKMTIAINDVTGKLIMQEKAKEVIDVTRLKSGVYFLSIRNEYGVLGVRKLIKE